MADSVKITNTEGNAEKILTNVLNNEDDKAQTHKTENANEQSEEWPSDSYSIKFDYYHDIEEDIEEKQPPVPLVTVSPETNLEVKANESRSGPESIIQKFKIALTFLLHPNSPLFENNETNNNNIEVNDGDDQTMHQFQQSCFMFNNNKNYEQIGDIQFWSQRLQDLDSLYDIEYKQNQHRILYNLWINWKNEEDEKDAAMSGHNYLISRADTVQLQQFCDLFMKDTKDIFDDAVNSLRGYTQSKAKRLTRYDTENNLNKELTSNYNQLQNVTNTKGMKKWLSKNRVIKSAANTDDNEAMIINNNSTPMFEWNWKEIVSFIDEIDEIKHFSSVLYQYQINGKELCAMNIKHIQYLIECSMMNNNNFDLNGLNDIKLQCKQQNVEWYILNDAIKIKTILDGVRVQSHIVSKYFLAARIIQAADNVFDDVKHQKEGQKIHELVSLLQVDPKKGPKYFWKMDTIYFNKIDNFLAVLIANQDLRNLFQKCFPDFLEDENNELSRFEDDFDGQYDIKKIDSAYKRGSLYRQLSGHDANVYDDKRDYLDKSIDLVCIGGSCKKVTYFVHDLNRLYIKTFCVLLLSLLTGCICVSLWYFNSSLLQINEAMSLSLKVLGDRTRNKMVYDFWKPQMFTNTAINAILHSPLLDKIAADPGNLNVTKYDYYMQQFSEHASADSVWSLWLYNNDTNGFIGGLRSDGDDDSILLSVYDGICQNYYYYNNETRKRDLTRIHDSDCDYIPRSRPWFTLGVSMANTAAAWTDPYEFARGEVGMSLVAPIIDEDGTLLIFLCEIITDTLSSSLSDTFTAMPSGTVLMMATANFDVMISSIGKDGVDIRTDFLTRNSNDALVSDSINYLRNYNQSFDADITFEEYNEENGFYFSLYPFNMIYIDFFSNNPSDLILEDSSQNGFVIVANDSSYLRLIEMANEVTNIILVIMLIISFLNICWQMQYYKQKNKNLGKPTRAQLIKINHMKNQLALQLLYKSTANVHAMSGHKSLSQNTTNSSLANPSHLTPGPEDPDESKDSTYELKSASKKHHKTLLKCHCNTNALLIFTFAQIIITLAIVSVMWEYNEKATTERLLQDIYPKHEFHEVGDEVHYMFETSDMVEQSLRQNYQQMIDGNDTVAMDMFFINMMKSYVRPNSEFTPFMIYFGTPEGRFVGSIRIPNSNELQHFRRDESTDFVRRAFAVIEGNVADYNDMTDEQDLYDPRCRPWYIAALDKSFTGTMSTAYPGTSFRDFYYDPYPPKLTQNCDTAKEEAMSLYGITQNNSNDFRDMSSSNFVNNDKYSLVWSRYVFAELTTIGLTASSTIQNADGEVLAVIAIDWVLDSLSQLLVHSVENIHENETVREHSWIFEANANDAAMIASSDMITITDTSQLEGCLTFSGGVDAEQIPFIATDHPQYDIRVMSEEIVSIHKISSLPINYVNSRPGSKSLAVPLGLPHLESGRISYYEINKTKENNHESFNVDWTVSRTIDFSKMDVQDIRFSIMLGVSIIFAVALLLKRISNTYSTSNANANDEEEEDEYDEEEEAERYGKIMYKMKRIITDSANAVWYRKYGKMVGLRTTEMTKDFCANRANLFIASTEDKYLFLKCFWQSNKYYSTKKIIFSNIFESNLYASYVAIVIGIHLILSMFESEQVFPGLLACVILEYIDFIFVFIKRYIQFDLDKKDLITLFEINYGFKHKYVDFFKQHSGNTLFFVLRGPYSYLIVVHGLLLLLILLDFMGFKYTFILPILPGLLILRNMQIFNFVKDFFYALWKSKKVLASYLFFIFTIAILSISLFGFMTNQDENNSQRLINSFYSIGEAMVTSFVYMSTAENYKIVYDIFDNEYYKKNQSLGYYALSFLIIVGMLGTFCFIPLIIHQFECAFNELEIKHGKSENFQKTICIIAAFVMLDMNNDQGIDHEELKQLINRSILSDRHKVFDVFHNDQDEEKEDDDIDLVGFVNFLLGQEFKNSITKTSSPQNKLQALIECNLIRRPQYNTMILITMVMPAYIFSVLKGLNGFSDASIDYILIVLFVFNFIDINMRWFSFGFGRYFDMKSYPVPNYIIASINKYLTTQTTFTAATADKGSAESVRLSAQEIHWANNNLNEIRPLSIEEKDVMTLIHRIELVMIYFTAIAYLAAYLSLTGNGINDQGFEISFIQFGILIRTFTLLKSNQTLTYSIFTVFPQFISLIIFLFLYIYWWARLGTILFGDNVTDIVIEEVYDVAPSIAANFNSPLYAILCLIQLLFGEGWHEIMYLNSLATTMKLTMYFIFYVTVVTIVVSNIFIGLFLAGIDNLDNSHKAQKDLKKLQKCLKSKKLFNKYAKKKIKSIQYKLKENAMVNKKLNNQLIHINKLLKQVNAKLQINDLQ